MPGKQERQRRLARERYQRRMARETERQQRARRITQLTAGGVVVLVIIGVVIFTVVQLTGSNGKATAGTTPSATPSASHSPSASPSASPTPTGPPWKASTAKWAPAANGPVTHCTYTPNGVAARDAGVPPSAAYPKDSYQARIKTNRGTIVIDLLNSKAPCTVNSFGFLATKGYFNNTPCPRVATGSGLYLLQCGDPTGTGVGGPGYEFANENLAGAKYTANTVAMANVSSVPNSNGSQFFLVYQNSQLPASYTPFGTIVSGLNILQNVAKAGSDNSNAAGGGHPKETVQIESVTIKKT